MPNPGLLALGGTALAEPTPIGEVLFMMALMNQIQKQQGGQRMNVRNMPTPFGFTPNQMQQGMNRIVQFPGNNNIPSPLNNPPIQLPRSMPSPMQAPQIPQMAQSPLQAPRLPVSTQSPMQAPRIELGGTAMMRPPFESVMQASEEPFDYQDNNQEKIIHGKWAHNAIRHDLEGAGDIFRELSKESQDFGYISEKTRRLDRLFDGYKSKDLHFDDTIEGAWKNDKENIGNLLKAWENQPAKTQEQKLAKQLNIELIKGNIKEAKSIAKEIKTLEKAGNFSLKLPTKLYHGSYSYSGKPRLNVNEDFITKQPYLSLTDNPEIAKVFTAEKGKPSKYTEKDEARVKEFIGKDLKILDASDFQLVPNEYGGMDIKTDKSNLSEKDKELAEALLYGLDLQEDGAYVKKLLEMGYDGIKFPATSMVQEHEDPELYATYKKGNEVRIFNQKALKKLKQRKPSHYKR